MALSPSAPIHNGLLASLPSDTLTRLMPKFSEVVIAARQGLYVQDGAIDAAYFPQSGMISLVSNLDDGTQAEVGIIGQEGMLGTSLLSGVNTSFVEAMVQMSGIALRIGITEFRQELETSGPFRAIILRYNEALQAQIMQTAACSGRHGLEHRLARWLLMAHDRASQDELPLTQESWP